MIRARFWLWVARCLEWTLVVLAAIVARGVRFVDWYLGTQRRAHDEALRRAVEAASEAARRRWEGK